MDWNGDGKKDLLCGDSSGKVVVFINTGSADKPTLAQGAPVLSDGKPIEPTRTKWERDEDGNFRQVPNTNKIKIGEYSKLHWADWNGDGLKDLLIGQETLDGRDNILVYLNQGTAQEPKLGKPQEVKLPGPKLSRPSPFLVDLDKDGKLDMVCGTEFNKIYFFQNIGSNEQPSYAQGVPLKLEGFQKNIRCRIDVTDWNNDGKLDLLVGDVDYSVRPRSTGHVWLFLGK